MLVQNFIKEAWTYLLKDIFKSDSSRNNKMLGMKLFT